MLDDNEPYFFPSKVKFVKAYFKGYKLIAESLCFLTSYPGYSSMFKIKSFTHSDITYRLMLTALLVRHFLSASGLSMTVFKQF